MIIRKIKTEDNAAMAKIIRDSLWEFGAAKPGTVYFDESTDHLNEIFIEKRSVYFIIENDGEIAGGSGIFPTEGLPSNTCELVKMYIDKSFRGNGYGQTLLKKCIEEAKKLGYAKMYLESMPELTNAITMYVKNGFTHIPGPIGNSGHTGCNIWMIKILEESEASFQN
ncbi:MAG TPA: GNAT family N-acetyltransferase [Hanamia sp.]